MRAALALLLCGLGCEDEIAFTYPREAEPCIATIPTACGVSARCVLDDEHYLEGAFPGSRRFVVRTEGETELEIQTLLYERRATGTELRFVVYEPSCGERSTWDSGGRDLFRLTDADGVLTVRLGVHRSGDHLVEMVSDAYCSYLLKVDY